MLNGAELDASAPFVLPANAPIQQYLVVPLQRPPGGTVAVPDGNPTSSYTCSPNDASAADLDGDGEYEVVLKWDPSNSRDNASAGLSGHQLWRASDNTSLRIYSTTIPAANRLYTLMHDPQYRLAMAWQNVGYNQPPHPIPDALAVGAVAAEASDGGDHAGSGRVWEHDRADGGGAGAAGAVKGDSHHFRSARVEKGTAPRRYVCTPAP